MVALPGVKGVPPSRIIIVLVASCLSVMMFINMGGHVRRPSFDYNSWAPQGLVEKPDSQKATVVADVYNNTLGFEKILVLNLPERGDKRDALTLASSLTNMTFTYIDGVRGNEVINKSLPFGQEARKMPEPMLGSWRAHMNAIRAVVENGYSSALILEDDVDWDIHLKSQLNDFAYGSRYLQNQTNNDITHSPYGDGWDILWLGHCHDTIDERDSRTYVIQNDPTVPAVDQLTINNPDLLHKWPDHSRIVHVVGKPICTFAYAVSYQGAQKILYALSVKELRGLFDNALSWWCTDKHQNARCLDAHPSYFAQHRARGGSGKNSDNQASHPAQEKAETKNIRYSTRLNLEQLLTGRNDYIDSYPEELNLPSNNQQLPHD